MNNELIKLDLNFNMFGLKPTMASLLVVCNKLLIHEKNDGR